MAVHYLLRRGISGGSPLNPLRGLLPVSQELGRHPLSSAAAGDAVARLRGARGREDVKQLLKATSYHPILCDDPPNTVWLQPDQWEAAPLLAARLLVPAYRQLTSTHCTFEDHRLAVAAAGSVMKSRGKAYVTQDDNLIGTLTVRETISYSARLRLPDNIPREEKRALVEGTIIEMGLQDCADTVIGNWHLRGISGGEKRRVSIALEILMRPRLLFLDEPTSGLDSILRDADAAWAGKGWSDRHRIGPSAE